MPKQTKKVFPKKAKLISDGGLYRIIKLDKPVLRIDFPITRRVEVNQPDLYFVETWKFLLKFEFMGVKGGYAEFRQYETVRITS